MGIMTSLPDKLPKTMSNVDVEVLEDGTELLLQPYADELEDSDKVFYPTQFVTLNLSTGKNIRDLETNEIISRPRGIRNGGQILMSGQPTIGKTTLGLNIAGHIKQVADNMAISAMSSARTQIHFLATEDGMEEANLLKNAYITKEQQKRGELIIYPADKVWTESTADLIDNIAAWKEENKSKLMIPQPKVGGGTKLEYIPTILFMDSLSGLRPKCLIDKKDNEQNNMWHAVRNKENGILFINKFEKLRRYNIICIWIVHVGDKFSANGMPLQKQYQALASDKKISDGKVPQFYADLFMFISKITDYDGKSKSVQDILEVDDTFIGNGIEVITPKNRWGDSSKRSIFRLVSDYSIGFNPYYSLLYELKSRDIIKGAAYKSLDGYPDKFRGRDVGNLIKTDERFANCLITALEKDFEWLLEANNVAIPRYKEYSSYMSRLLS